MKKLDPSILLLLIYQYSSNILLRGDSLCSVKEIFLGLKIIYTNKELNLFQAEVDQLWKCDIIAGLNHAWFSWVVCHSLGNTSKNDAEQQQLGGCRQFTQTACFHTLASDQQSQMAITQKSLNLSICNTLPSQSGLTHKLSKLTWG